jgi:lipopolysaccharide export LptBFGC system permease protein LptF
MVFTLHRYIFRELVKVFAPAAVALTLIVTLGSILGPIHEYGVGPRHVIHLMGYFLPISLTFVLPMAALFAAALVYGRFASDNELDACRASGISLVTLVYPGLGLAIVIAIANLVLSFHVMPIFVRGAEKSLKADAKHILFRNIQQRGYYRLPPDGRYRLYADESDPESGTLWGTVVVEVREGVIKRITTAESAKVDFNPHRRFNEVRITGYNIYQMGSEDEGGFSAEWLPLTVEFGSLLGDDIKFKKLDEMKRIRDVDLMLFYPIAKLADEVYTELTTEVLAQDIAAKMNEDANGLYQLYSGERIVKLRAGGCSVPEERIVELSGDIVVMESDVDSKQLLRTMRCKKALLHVEGEASTLTLTMEVYSPMWRQPDGTEGFARRPIIRGLIIPKAVEAAMNEFRTENSLDVEKLASDSSVLQKGPSPKLAGRQAELRGKIQETLAEIEAETHSRLVFGIGCVSMIMIGIGLGIILRGGHLLSAFGASCVPAAMLIVCIMAGRNLAKNLGSQTISGTLLMWVGLVFLSLFGLGIYRKLLKN